MATDGGPAAHACGVLGPVVSLLHFKNIAQIYNVRFIIILSLLTLL